MRVVVALIILTLMACAALASHQRKPFPLLIGASDEVRPAVWPSNASGPRMPGIMICQPMLVPFPAAPKPVVRT